MSEHFADARYHLKRAVDHLADGIRERLEPLETRVRVRLGRERQPEPSRLDRVEARVRLLIRRVRERMLSG